MRKRKPINYQIEVNCEPLITQIPKYTLDSLVFSLELAIYDLMAKEKTEKVANQKEMRR